MKRNDYVNIQGWMVSELQLKGNELILFAIIHGYSKDGINSYRGSKSYISKFMSISPRSVVNLINRLVEKKYVSKQEYPTGNLYKSLHFGEEETEFSLVQKLHTPCAKDAQLGSAKDAHNINNTNNKVIDIDFDKLLQYLNDKTGKKMRVVNSSNKQSFKARLKDGYKKEDIVNAITNAVLNDYHIETNFQYLTIEFFTRASTLDKYAFISSKKKSNFQGKSVTDKIEVG